MKTKQEIGKKTCAIIVIIAMMVSNFWLVGKEAVSYALELAKTNNDSVEFSAYFLDEKGEKVTQKEKKMSEKEEMLYVEIGVKKEGYFDGRIMLDSKNMEIDRDYKEELVEEITESGEVKVKQINAGENVTIGIKVKAKEGEQVEKENLQSESKVRLEGEYVNSKNVGKEKTVGIKGEAEVEISWKSEEEMELSLEVFTNNIYKIGEERKRVIQAEVESRLKDNNYPVRRSEIKVEGLAGAEEIRIEARNVEGTNKNIEFGEENYTYNKETGEIDIELENTNEKEISWKKGEKDEIIITYILGEEREVTEEKIRVEGKIETYDGKEIKKEIEGQIGEEKDGAISYEIETEKEIYKGKIQTGEAKEYKTEVKVNVNYINEEDKIEIEEEGNYVVGEEVQEGKVEYKETRISKEEVLKVLGEEGYINIKDGEGRIVGNINKDSETNEAGKVIIRYNEGTRKVIIETSKPQEVGSIKIENIKEAGRGEKTEEQIKEITGIEEKVAGNYKEVKKTIELKDTETEAKLEVSVDKLTTLEKNTDVKMTVTLLNNEESKDLYKNPSIRIKMPRQVKKIEAKCKLLYGNGLSLGERQIVEEDGRYVIEIKLEGEQTEYNTEVVEGTKIVIYADLELDKKEANSEEKIELEYTNEKARSYKDEGRQEVGIKVESRAGLILANGIDEYGIEAIGNEGNKDVRIGMEEGEKEATVKIEAINNEGSKIGDVKILGHFPTKEEDTLGVELIGGIETDQEGAKIYYSNEENPTEDIEDERNGWKEQGDRFTVKSYLIVMEELQNSEAFTANYKVKVPNVSNYNMNANETYTVSYLDEKTNQQKLENSSEINLTTGKGPEINIDVKAIAGNDVVGTGLDTLAETGEQVVAGEIIKYEVTLTNNGNEEATNVELQESITDNAVLLNYEKIQKDVGEGEEGPESLNDFTSLNERNITKEVGNIGIGESISIDLYAMAKDAGKLVNQIQLIHNNRTKNIYLTNEVAPSNIQTTLTAATFDSDEESIKSDNIYIYNLKIENKSPNQINNLNVEFVTNDLFKVVQVDILEGESTNTINNGSKINLKANETKEIYVYVQATNKGKAELYAVVTENKTKVRSNKLTKEVISINLATELVATNSGENVKPGQEIHYTITIDNLENSIPIGYLRVEDSISNLIEVENVLVNNVVLSKEEYNINYQNNEETIIIEFPLEKGELKTIEIVAKVRDNALDMIKEDSEIKNNAKIIVDDDTTIDLEEVSHILKVSDTSEENKDNYVELDDTYTGRTPGSIENDENDDTDNEETQGETGNQEDNNQGENNNQGETGNQGGTENQGENDKPTETYSIFGMVWKDENKDGIKDNQESKIENVLVELINADNATKITEATTNADGIYTFNEVVEGKYIVVFNYNTETYMPTTYQLDGVVSNKNSDALISKITIDGKEKTAAITDTIDVRENKTNIDLGLVDAVNYDLSLSKTINKVTVTNAKGTKTSEYNGAELARVEINSRNLSGSTVIVEYKISVKNEGETAGYVKSIVDYKPTDLSFDSNINNGWYLSNGNLYYSGFANTKIEPGDSKEVTLILTKTMTESNTGLINNLAEIAEDYNSLGLVDKDSISGNKQKSEDDLGAANLVISVETGAAISYVSFVISVLGVLISVAYLTSIRMPKGDEKF